MTDTKTKPQPHRADGMVLGSYIVTPKFARWFKEERKRRFLTGGGLLQEMALNYVTNHRDATPWPEEETP